MATIEDILIEVIGRIGRLEREIDDLRSQAGETISLDSTTILPSDPYNGQIVLLADGSGANQNGTFYRYDDGVDDWAQIL